MIAAYLVGDDKVLGWLSSAAEIANSGLARAITNLTIDLRAKARDDGQVSDRIFADRSRSLRSSVDWRTDQSAQITTLRHIKVKPRSRAFGTSSNHSLKETLRNEKQAFAPASTTWTIRMAAPGRQMDLPGYSFLGSALDEFAPRIRDEVDAALGDALRQ